ncbi:MAG: thymidylate kinase [Halioglobus sp.]|jgi:thymidylate kinase
MSYLTNQPGADRVPLNRVIAVVGCDGTGKTTLTRDLTLCLSEKGPARRRYMGLVSGEVGDKIKGLPIIGPRLENNLHRKVDRALDMEKKLPGTGTALIMYLFSIWRAYLVLRVKQLSKRGVQVIADRYPQSEIDGFHYDGVGLTVGRTSNWLVRKLAEQEHKMYDWMSAQVPALVIRLHVDEDTAQARKLDHDIAEIRDKIAVMPKLNFNGAVICEIDAAVPYPEVLEAMLKAIEEFMPASP